MGSKLLFLWMASMVSLVKSIAKCQWLRQQNEECLTITQDTHKVQQKFEAVICVVLLSRP